MSIGNPRTSRYARALLDRAFIGELKHPLPPTIRLDSIICIVVLWSDQYDLRLQIAGLPFDATEIAVRGDVAAAKFALFHLTGDGTVQAVEAVNSAPEFMGGRRIIAKRKRLTRARIEDMSVSMQELAS